MSEIALQILEGAQASTEYPLICERIKAELDAILSRAQTHYTNILESGAVLNEVRAKLLSGSGANTVVQVLAAVISLPMEELMKFRGLLF